MSFLLEHLLASQSELSDLNTKTMKTDSNHVLVLGARAPATLDFIRQIFDQGYRVYVA